MTETPESWGRLLRSPFPCDHIIQLYTDDAVLVRALARFIGAGLEQGEAAVAVATAEHIAALTARLAAIGCDVARQPATARSSRSTPSGRSPDSWSMGCPTALRSVR